MVARFGEETIDLCAGFARFATARPAMITSEIGDPLDAAPFQAAWWLWVEARSGRCHRQ